MVLTQSVHSKGSVLFKIIEFFITADIRGFVFFKWAICIFFIKEANFFKINLQVSLNNEE